jgi:hypothetical protein
VRDWALTCWIPGSHASRLRRLRPPDTEAKTWGQHCFPHSQLRRFHWDSPPSAPPSAFSSRPFPPSTHLPPHPTGAGDGADDAQILTLPYSRNRMRNWFSHACPIPLPTMARRLRCGIGAHIDAQTRKRSQRCAGKRIWASPLRPGPGSPGSQKDMQGADKRTPASRPPPCRHSRRPSPPSPSPFSHLRTVA